MSGRRAMLNVIAVVVGLYTALVGAIYVLQRGMIYFPSGDLPPPAAAGLPEMRAVEVETADGLTLVSWYRAARPGKPTIVYFHGNGGSIAGREIKVRPFLGAGFGVLMAEYRGYGGNPGSPTEDGLYADGRANLEFLVREGVAPRLWVLYGESLGTGVAVHLAAERPPGAPVGALFLEAPFASLAETASEHYPFLPARLLVKDRFDNIDKIAGVRAPVLIVHGEADGLIRPEHGRRVFERASAPKEAQWITGGGHNDLHEFGIARMAIAFVERRLSAAE